jgi:hypothetical protein
MDCSANALKTHNTNVEPMATVPITPAASGFMRLPKINRKTAERMGIVGMSHE